MSIAIFVVLCVGVAAVIAVGSEEQPEERKPAGTQEANRDIVGPLVLNNIKAKRHTTVQEVSDALGHRRKNSGGNLLGKGVGSEGGFNFDRGRDGSIYPTRRNGIFAVRGLSEPALDRLLENWEMTREQFEEWINTLAR